MIFSLSMSTVSVDPLMVRLGVTRGALYRVVAKARGPHLIAGTTT